MLLSILFPPTVRGIWPILFSVNMVRILSFPSLRQFANPKLKEPFLLFYHRFGVERENGFISFLSMDRREMLNTSFRIWTRITDSILHVKHYPINLFEDCPVGWGCRRHRLLLCRGIRPLPNECPSIDTKQFDDEVPAVLELWVMASTPALPSLLGPLLPGLVAPDRALSIG